MIGFGLDRDAPKEVVKVAKLAAKTLERTAKLLSKARLAGKGKITVQSNDGWSLTIQKRDRNDQDSEEDEG